MGEAADDEVIALSVDHGSLRAALMIDWPSLLIWLSQNPAASPATVCSRPSTTSVAPAYVHRDKLITPGAPLTLGATRLKWHDVAGRETPVEPAVAALARFFKIEPGEILVAHDELDLLPGQVKLKLGGSHAGRREEPDRAASPAPPPARRAG